MAWSTIRPLCKVAEELLDLIDRDGIAHADVDSSSLLERAATVDADQLALGVEQRAARVAGIDGRIGLDAVGVFQQRAGRRLVAMHARDDPVGNGRLKIGGQQEGIADGETPVADAHRVAVAQFRRREIIAAEQFDQRHVAGRIDADKHGVVELPVGHAALHVAAGRFHHVEIRQRIAVRTDDHARSTAPTAGSEDGDGRLHGSVDRRDPLLFGLQHRLGRLLRRRRRPRANTSSTVQSTINRLCCGRKFI